MLIWTNFVFFFAILVRILCLLDVMCVLSMLLSAVFCAHLFMMSSVRFSIINFDWYNHMQSNRKLRSVISSLTGKILKQNCTMHI